MFQSSDRLREKYGSKFGGPPCINFDLQSTLKINTFECCLSISKQVLSLTLKVLNNSVYVSVLKSKPRLALASHSLHYKSHNERSQQMLPLDMETCWMAHQY